MSNIIIDTNINNLIKKLDYSLAKRIDRAIISKVTSQVKKDIKKETKKLFHATDKINKYISSKITNNNIGIIKANYIAKWQNSGTKERIAKKTKYLFFETPNGLIRKKIVKGIEGKKYMELADSWLTSGKYSDLIDKTADNVIKKVLGD